MILSTAQEKLLKLLRIELFSCDEKLCLQSDAEQVLSEAVVQAVALVALSSVKADDCTFDTYARIKTTLNTFLQKNVAVNRGHLVIDELFQKAQIPYTIIKGLASAKWYPDYLMRSMGDVDFLVNRADFDRAKQLLLENGFKVRPGEREHHIAYDKDGVRYELHYLPPGIPEGDAGERLREYLADTVASSERIAGEFGEISVPDTMHHGLIVLLHNVHHLTSDGLGLRHLCDWAVFINSLSADEFSHFFDTVLNETGILKFARVMSFAVSDAFGCKNVFNNTTREEKQLAKQLICDVFSAGNFGQKNADRSHEYILISSKNEKAVSMPAQAVRSLNKIVYSHWKIAKKCKVLLPFGWVYFCGRYAVRSLMGKRPKIRPKSILSEAQKRKEFYKKLRLFEK